MSYWQDQNVLVTGCSGFLGLWLTKALVGAGANVTGLVRDGAYRSQFFNHATKNKINIIWGSIEDYNLLERVVNEYEIEVVFHLAAQAIVGVANQNPLATFEANIKGTWVLLEVCRHHPRLQKIVVASSDKAYGNHDQLPYQEHYPLQGRHPYDVSKSCADLLALSYHNTYQLPVCITRCGNLFGPGDMNFNRIVPGTMQSMIRNETPVVRSDGSPKRDYVYVEDIVEGYLKLAEKMDDEKILGQAFNFGSGEPTSVLKLIKLMLKVADKERLGVDIKNQASSEIIHQYLSSELALNELGWHPRQTLEKRLEQTYQWYHHHFMHDSVQ